MDADQPKSEDRDAQSGRDSARARLDSLTSGGSGKKEREEKDEKSGAVLTERQRIEARKRRQAKRRRPVKGNPLSRGMRATGFEIRRTASFLGGSVIAALAALGPIFSAIGMGLVWLIERIGAGLVALRRLFSRALAVLGRALIAVDRIFTPHRALLLVGLVAAVVLGVSQFKGLGAIEIGQPGYSGIEDITRAPSIDHTTPAGVHTKILVPIAVVAFAAIVLIAVGGRLTRWRRLAAMTLTMIGLLTVAVALLVDLPDAMDVGEAKLAYAGVRAILLSGFWLELAAGASLAVIGLALLFEPSKAKAPRSRREHHPSVAGSRA